MSSLSKLRIAVLVADGVEEEELTEPVRALSADGATVHLLAPRPGKVQCFRKTVPGIKIDIEGVLESAEGLNYDALHLPGGLLSVDELRSHPKVRLFLWAHNQIHKPCGAVGHAPLLFVSVGLVSSRTLTSAPTIQLDIRNAGGRWVDQPVVSDLNWVTARQPSDLTEYIRTFRTLLERQALAKSRAA